MNPTLGGGGVNPAAGELDGVLRPFRRRALADSALRWALLGVTGWCGAVGLLLVLAKLRPTGHVAVVAGSLAAGALLAVSAAWAIHRPGLSQVARVADARLDLQERLASALCFTAGAGDMESRLRADAAEAARRHNPAEVFPLRRHRQLAAVALVAALAAGVLALTPNPQAAALAREVADQTTLAQARKVVASARERLGNPSSPNARNIATALQEALSQPELASTPLAALVALSNLSRELATLDNPAGQGREPADAAAGDALAGAPGAGRVSRDLSSGDLNAAAAALRALAGNLPALSPAQRKALAAALAQAAAAAGNQVGGSGTGSSAFAGDPPLAAALSRAASALSAAQLGAAERALRAAANGAAASGAAVSLQTELGAIQAAVQTEATQVASQAQAGTGARKPATGSAAAQRGVSNQGAERSSGAPGGATAGKPGAGSGGSGPDRNRAGPDRNRAGPGSNSAGPGSNGAGPGSNGAGSGGNSAGSGGNGAGSGRNGAGSGGAGSSGEGRPGAGAKGRPSRVRQADATGASSGQVFIGGQPGQGEQVTGEQLGAGERVRTTPYQSVLPGFEKTALEGLGANVVNADDQNLVRSYFSSLGGGQ